MIDCVGNGQFVQPGILSTGLEGGWVSYWPSIQTPPQVTERRPLTGSYPAQINAFGGAGEGVGCTGFGQRNKGIFLDLSNTRRATSIAIVGNPQVINSSAADYDDGLIASAFNLAVAAGSPGVRWIAKVGAVVGIEWKARRIAIQRIQTSNIDDWSAGICLDDDAGSSGTQTFSRYNLEVISICFFYHKMRTVSNGIAHVVFPAVNDISGRKGFGPIQYDLIARASEYSVGCGDDGLRLNDRQG